MAVRKLPDRELVHQLYAFDAATGVFTHRARPRELFATQRAFNTWTSCCYAGQTAGCLVNGYIMIGIKGTTYRAHRLAWLLVHGEPVPAEIDHIDGDPANNRISNLRAATHAQNISSGYGWKGKSGERGVSINRQGRYQAHIGVEYEKIHLGTFDTLKEAIKARRKAAEQLHGKFARHR
jgi:hypothetical protein